MIKPDTPVSPGHSPKSSTPTAPIRFKDTGISKNMRDETTNETVPRMKRAIPPNAAGLRVPLADRHDSFDIGIGWWKAVAACTLLPNLPY